MKAVSKCYDTENVWESGMLSAKMVKGAKKQSEKVGKQRRNNVPSEVIANANYRVCFQVYLKIANISKHE